MNRYHAAMFAGLVILLIGAVLAISQILIIGNIGYVKTVGVNVDRDFIDWGNLTVLNSGTEIINVENIENTPILLSLNSSNWNPANASNYLTLSWNYTGTILQPSMTVPIELYLEVQGSFRGQFTFDIWIIAEEI